MIGFLNFNTMSEKMSEKKEDLQEKDLQEVNGGGALTPHPVKRPVNPGVPPREKPRVEIKYA